MQSQSDLIYEEVVNQIRSGKLFPGDTVDLGGLREKFGVSGTPIRDAITRLEAVGLVEKSPRSGAKVFQPNLERALGLLEVYAELEGAAAAIAATRIDERKSKLIIEKTIACENYVDQSGANTTHGYFDLNMEFHLAVMEAADNSDLTELILISATQLMGFLRSRHMLPGQPRRSAAEHREIAEKILAGESEAARSAMISHVRIDGKVMIDTIKMMNQHQSN